MANPNTPFGFLPVRHYFGGVLRTNMYNIADAYNTDLFEGDPVKVTGTGKNIALATAGSSNVVTGVFFGCHYVDSRGDTQFGRWPASTAIKTGTVVLAEVWDDPFILYKVQSGSVGIVAADIRLLCDMVSGSGSTATGRSAWSVAGVAGSENQFKILGLHDMAHPGGLQNAYGAYAVVEGLFGKHELVATAPTEV